MKPRARNFSTSVAKTFHFKLMTITATVIFAVAAVVVSVHSSSSPAIVPSPGPAAPLASAVTATKTDALFTDVDGDTQADPGDTIKYSVNISASGDDATGVTFTDTVDPNTAFVPGSLTATPVAVDDSYGATGNIRISVAAPGVRGNDFVGVPTATITAPPTSANGGDVSLAADGSFTYNPPAGFEGVDTFTYTLTNAAGSNNATVSITVSGMIWFIDNNAAACTTLAAGCGRLTNPFSSLSAFAALNDGSGNNPAANDNIFIYESASDYAGPVTLLNGQRLIGQDATASLSSITGLTPPAGSDPLPATNSANGTIVNITTGNAITVGSGNSLIGFTGGDSTTDISGTGFGTLTISDVTLNGTGEALNLNTGALNATFGSISSTNSATTGISLTTVAGNLTSPTTTITNPTGVGISVATSTAILNFGNTSSTLSGGTGVSLLSNTGTITFAALNISPDASQEGLVATDNSGTITSTSGAISSTGAIAVEISRASGTTPLAISQTSISASGGLNGIKLTNVSGSFTVTGDGGGSSNGSGGTISGTTAAGVLISTASNVSLGYMNIANSGADGINTTGVNGFTLNRSNVSDSAGTTSDDGIAMSNTTGTVTVDNSSIANSPHNGFTIDNNNTNMAGFNLTNTTISCASGQPCDPSGSTGNDGLLLTMRGTSVLTSGLISGSIFSGSKSVGVQIQTNDTGRIGSNSGGSISASITVQSNTFTSNGEGVDIDSSQVSNLTFQVLSNAINGSSTAGGDLGSGTAINAFTAAGVGTGPASHTFVGKIDGNLIGTQGINDSGSSFGSGIRAVVQGSATAGVISITNNTIREVPNGDIITAIGQNGAGSSPSASARFKILNNSMPQPSGSNQSFCGPLNTACASNGIFVLADEGSLVCNTITGNSIYDLSLMNGIADIYLAERTGPPAGAQLTVEGTGGDNSIYIQANNTLAGPSPFIDESGNTSQVAPGACGVFPSAALSLGGKLATNGAATQTREGSATQREDILMAGGLEKPLEEKVRSLDQGSLNWMVQAALARWEESGISAEDMMRLRQVTFEVADLPGQQLATATSTGVQIDDTAAAYGWYSDISPMEDLEFDVPVPGRELQTTEYSAAFGRMDLLTVVMRELGVTYRQGKKKLPTQLQPLMESTLSPAVRRLPDSRNIQLPGSKDRVSGLKYPSRETSRVWQIRTGSTRSTKTRISKPDSTKGVAFNSVAKKAADRNRLMHHAPRIRTTAPMLSSMLADVMLNIGTLPAGESVTITFNVTVDDPFGGALPQVSNQGTVSGSNFADVLTDDPSVGGVADPTVTPIDLPGVSVAVSPTSVLEDGATNLVYTFTRGGSTANALTVNFSIGGTANFGASPNDYTQTGAASFTPPTGTVTFGAGNATATVTVNPETDTTVEPDETVVLTVTSGTGYTIGSPSSASGTITNDDADVSVAVAPTSVAEDGAANLVYTFTRAGATTNSLTVNFSVGGTANFGVSPNDYTQTGATTFTPPTGTVTFTAGSSTATVTVNPETDTTIEADETVILTITSGAGYNVSSPSAATGTITNDDANVSVAVSPAAVAEDGATNLVYTFTRTGFTAGSLTVNFSVGGTATFGVSPNDYTQTGATTFTTTTGSVSFTAGSPTATVTVNPETDASAESDETVIITVTAGASYNVVSPSSATGTILNDDTLVNVAVAPSSTAEGGANMVYTFSRTGPTTSALTVNFSVGGSASFPADYAQSGAATFTPPTATVTFGVGSSTKTVTVTPLTDCAVEGSETVVFTVQPGTGYGVGSPNPATGTITNTPDSTPPTITCNADVVADFNPAVGGAVVTYTAPVGSDSCPGAITSQIAGLPSGSTFPLGTTVNTFRVTDASGNTAECSFKVTVALTSIVGLDSVTITGASFIDSYNSAIGYPASKSSLANVLSNGTITMGNSGKVWGNVRSTQAGINMTGASQVTGDATAGTTVSLSGSASVGGTITNGALAPAITLPAVPACGPPYSPNTGISGTYTYNSGTGDLSLSGVNIATLANGNYCFHNITMGNSAQLKVNGLVTIKMTGTLNLSGATSFTNTTGIPGNLRVLSSLASGGNGVILGNGTNVTMVVYAPQTGVSISGSAPLFGTVAAKRITIGNSGALHYDTQLKTIWPALWILIVGP
jgi:hypothetical protein